MYTQDNCCILLLLQRTLVCVNDVYTVLIAVFSSTTMHISLLIYVYTVLIAVFCTSGGGLGRPGPRQRNLENGHATHSS